MLRWLGGLLILLLLIVLLAAAGAAVMTINMIEDQPLVSDNQAPDYATVADSKVLLKRILRQLESGAGTTQVWVSEQELQNLAQLGSYTFERLQADVDLQQGQINSRLSIRLPANPLGKFLNLSALFAESSQGIAVDKLQIGSVSLPGKWLLPLLARLADSQLQNHHASELLASVQGLGIRGDTAILVLQSPGGLRGKLKQTLKNFQASRMPAAERDSVLHYYQLLTDLAGDNWYAQQPFSNFLVPLMTEAAGRAQNGSAVAENRAVIWALAIYFSYGRFETLVGDLVSSQRKLQIPAYYVTLGGRRDLMQHFLYSAAITLATQQGIGIAAGEFKELLDSGNGGSGFSFADLAADRAGVHFATESTASEAAALALQQHFRDDPSEAGYFPDIAGLAEGLGEAVFEQRYGNTRSAAYRRELTTIDRRITSLPAYTRLREI
jgi:hypothetical protein